jgi:hypothetical protein
MTWSANFLVRCLSSSLMSEILPGVYLRERINGLLRDASAFIWDLGFGI